MLINHESRDGAIYYGIPFMRNTISRARAEGQGKSIGKICQIGLAKIVAKKFQNLLKYQKLRLTFLNWYYLRCQLSIKII